MAASSGTTITRTRFAPQHAPPTSSAELAALCDALSRTCPSLRVTTIDGTDLGALSALPAEVLVELKGVLRARLSIESRQSPLMVTRALVYGFHEPAVRFSMIGPR